MITMLVPNNNNQDHSVLHMHMLKQSRFTHCAGKRNLTIESFHDQNSERNVLLHSLVTD